MKRIFVLFAVLTAILFAHTTPVYAAGGTTDDPSNEGCPHSWEITVYGYLPLADLPVAEGEIVSVVADCEGNLVIRHDVPLAGGFAPEYFRFPYEIIQDITLIDGRDGSWSDFGASKLGMTGRIEYDDWYLWNGTYGEDGVVDHVYLYSVPTWNRGEIELLQMGNQMVEEFLKNNLAVFSYSGDCYPDRVTLNGAPLVEGPWGRTIKVPASGGTLKGEWFVGNCGSTEGWTAKVFIKPGEKIWGFSEGSKSTFENYAPEDFCLFWEFQLPQWQPESVSVVASKECRYIFGQDDDSFEAEFARRGLGTLYPRTAESNPEGFTPYSVWDKTSVNLFQIPGITWQQVDSVEVGGAVYTATSHTDWIALSLVGGEVDGEHYWQSDLSVSNPGILVFVPDTTKSGREYFQPQWEEMLIFRLKTTWDGKVRIEKATFK